MNWQSSPYENGNTDKRHLYSQCNPGQTFNDIHHTTKEKKKKEKQKRTYLGTQKTTDNTIYTRFQIIQSIHNEKSYKALIKKQNKTKQNTKKSKTI